MMREGKNESDQAMVDDALEPPNTINAATGVPEWWTSDEDAWEELRRQL